MVKNINLSFLTLEDERELLSIICESPFTSEVQAVLDTTAPLSPRPKTQRKLKHEADELLRTFIHSKNLLKRPKKEYLRCSIIRSHKRMLQMLFKKRLTRRDKQRLATRTAIQVQAWEQFRAASQSPLLGQVIKISPPGQTNGSKAQTRSFNNTYCRKYFETPAARKSYAAYVDYYFADATPADLSNKLNILCCLSEHDASCLERWEAMKHYLQVALLAELKSGWGT